MSKPHFHRSLASDNHTGVHPKILESLSQINQDHCHSYDEDPVTYHLRKKIHQLIGPEFDTHLVFNGTAANVLAIGHFIKPYHSVLCTEVSHLNTDECGAPEKILGCKLIALAHTQGKISLEAIKEQFIRYGDQHYSQVKMISVTQPTELGTVYTLKELKELRELCDEHKLYLHIDGARLSNAVVFLQTNFQEIAQYADSISFGGTKNGLLGAEMVLIRKDQSHDSHTFKFERKQALQLPSKTRFMAQQFLTYFEDDLWKEIATHSLNRAQDLATKLSAFVEIDYPVQSNAVFCKLPQKWIKDLRKEIFFYVWDPHTFQVRLMTCFDTTKDDIDRLIRPLNERHLKKD